MENTKKIIALRGRKDSGKTSTLKLVRKELLRLGAIEILYVDGLGYQGVDFYGIYEIWGILIGITSEGDYYQVIMDRVQILTGRQCDLILCTCRVSDQNHPGTNAAVRSFPDYPAEFIRKEYAEEHQHDEINAKDMVRIMTFIDAALNKT